METKEMKIVPPEGYEIDKENSTFECIKFKSKLTYEDIAKELFVDRAYYTDTSGGIGVYTSKGNNSSVFPNNATSKKQLEKLLAINKLMNVTKYLNGDWQPNWKNLDEIKWYLDYCEELGIEVVGCRIKPLGITHFKTKKLAQKAIDILGEDTIRLALSTDW